MTLAAKAGQPIPGAPKSRWKHWVARVSTTTALILGTWFLVRWAGFLGGVFFLGLLSGLTSMEWMRVASPSSSVVSRWILGLLCFFAPYGIHLMHQEGGGTSLFETVYHGALGLVVVVMLCALRFQGVLRAINRSRLFPLWGIALPLTAYVQIAHFFVDMGRGPFVALLWVLALIMITKITDIGALVLGSLFGRHKLAPVLSPGKTIEGAVGGVVVSMAFTWILHESGSISLQPFSSSPETWDLPKLMISAGIIAVFGILGDLVESAWKRLNLQKNSGNCLPGLGGIYDLTDSLVLSAPVACLLIRYFVFA